MQRLRTRDATCRGFPGRSQCRQNVKHRTLTHLCMQGIDARRAHQACILFMLPQHASAHAPRPSHASQSCINTRTSRCAQLFDSAWGIQGGSKCSGAYAFVVVSGKFSARTLMRVFLHYHLCLPLRSSVRPCVRPRARPSDRPSAIARPSVRSSVRPPRARVRAARSLPLARQRVRTRSRRVRPHWRASACAPARARSCARARIRAARSLPLARQRVRARSRRVRPH